MNGGKYCNISKLTNNVGSSFTANNSLSLISCHEKMPLNSLISCHEFVFSSKSNSPLLVTFPTAVTPVCVNSSCCKITQPRTRMFARKHCQQAKRAKPTTARPVSTFHHNPSAPGVPWSPDRNASSSSARPRSQPSHHVNPKITAKGRVRLAEEM